MSCGPIKWVQIGDIGKNLAEGILIFLAPRSNMSVILELLLSLS